MRTQNQGYRAFTLIEILVVVAIIALLLAVLLPSLVAARERAKSVVCASNGHQMGLALQMYTSVHRYTTAHHLVGSSVTSTEWVLFPVRLLRAMNASGKKTGQALIFSCPSSPIKEKWDGVKRISPGKPNGGLDTDFNTFDYGINDWGAVNVSDPCLGMGGHVYDPKYAGKEWGHERNKGEVAFEKIRRPSNMIAFADNNADVIGYGNWDTALDPTNTNENIGNRHSKKAMVLWADGHADMQFQSKLNDIKKPGVNAMWNNDAKSH